MSLTALSSAEDVITTDFPLLKLAWVASFVFAAFLASRGDHVCQWLPQPWEVQKS